MISDWYELPRDASRQLFSVNDVPYPLDDWLRLQNKMTTQQAVELTLRWYKNKHKNG